MKDGTAGKRGFPLPASSIERSIFLLRGHRVILAGDLAVFYDVEPRAFRRR